jgi:hypothetical protein
MFKETLKFILEMLKFFFISVPVFLLVYSALLIYLEIKNLLQWKMK